MRKCKMCNSEIKCQEPAILFIDKAGEDIEICENCECEMDNLMEGDDPGKIKESINYLYTCAKSISNWEVSNFLMKTIEQSKSAIEKNDRKDKPINLNEKQDYFAETKMVNVNNIAKGLFWISGLKFIAWATFLLIIIAGIIFSNSVSNYQFLIILVAFIIAFMTIAWTMVFLNMAENIANNSNNTGIIIQKLNKKV